MPILDYGRYQLRQITSCPPRHTHPTLAHPIAPTRFASEFSEIVKRAPSVGASIILRRLAVSVGSTRLERAHRRSARRYADYDPEAHKVSFAPQTLLLPKPNRVGLIAHELAHVLDHELSEDETDSLADDAFGVVISYDDRWPGKGLQKGRFRRR